MTQTETDLTNFFAASYGHHDARVMYKTTTCTTLQVQTPSSCERRSGGAVRTK